MSAKYAFHQYCVTFRPYLDNADRIYGDLRPGFPKAVSNHHLQSRTLVNRANKALKIAGTVGSEITFVILEFESNFRIRGQNDTFHQF